MKIKNLIKLVSFVTMLAVLPLHSYAGCGCGDADKTEQNQAQKEQNKAQDGKNEG